MNRRTFGQSQKAHSIDWVARVTALFAVVVAVMVPSSVAAQEIEESDPPTDLHVPADSRMPRRSISVVYAGMEGREEMDEVAAVSIDEGIERVMASARVVTISVPRSLREQSPSNLGCTAESCLTELAAFAGATHVLRTRLVDKAVWLDVFQARPFDLLATTEVESDEPATLGEEAEQQTMRLLGELVDPVDDPVALDESAPAPPDQSGIVVSQSSARERQVVQELPRRQTWALALAGVGAASALGGAMVLARGDESLCHQASAADCGMVRDMRPLGVTALGTGSMVALAGLLFYLIVPETSRSRLGWDAEAGRVSISGTF